MTQESLMQYQRETIYKAWQKEPTHIIYQTTYNHNETQWCRSYNAYLNDLFSKSVSCR
jgi:hypothetical protein